MPRLTHIAGAVTVWAPLERLRRREGGAHNRENFRADLPRSEQFRIGGRSDHCPRGKPGRDERPAGPHRPITKLALADRPPRAAGDLFLGVLDAPARITADIGERQMRDARA
jgi:hypothetical protein